MSDFGDDNDVPCIILISLHIHRVFTSRILLPSLGFCLSANILLHIGRVVCFWRCAWCFVSIFGFLCQLYYYAYASMVTFLYLAFLWVKLSNLPACSMVFHSLFPFFSFSRECGFPITDGVYQPLPISRPLFTFPSRRFWPKWARPRLLLTRYHLAPYLPAAVTQLSVAPFPRRAKFIRNVFIYLVFISRS